MVSINILCVYKINKDIWQSLKNIKMFLQQLFRSKKALRFWTYVYRCSEMHILVAYSCFNLNLEIFAETRSNRQQRCMSNLRYWKHHYESKKNVRRFRIPLKMVIKFKPILKTIVTNITPLGYFKFFPLHIVYKKLMRTKL
jgi:hypothetical protein